MTFIFEALQLFWRRHPALLYAISLLLGIYSALEWNPILLIPMGMIATPLLWPTSLEGLRRRFCLAITFAVSGWLLIHLTYQFPTLPAEGTPGTAWIDISSVSSTTTPFGKRWLYKGTIRAFEEINTRKIIARRIPYSLSMPFKSDVIRPSAQSAYQVQAVLKQSASGRYRLSVAGSTPWYPLSNTWSSAELRFNAKQHVAAYIQDHIRGTRSASFLTGIATGDFDDRLMQFEFSRFGLQHIMAISGFHFAIIAGILSFILRLVVSRRSASLLLILLLSGYCLFLGSSPSILRACAAILVVLFGLLFERRGAGLNSLGVAMLIVLLIDPLMVRHIGFQFSFATTAAILLLYSGSDFLMQKLFLKRPLSEMVEMDTLNQHAYLLLAFFRQAIALTIAVNLVALPIMLYTFHKFPILSLVYNLFFPFLVSLSMLFLIFGILGSVLFPPLGQAIHYINDTYTHFVLNFTYNLPTLFDVNWQVAALPVEWLIVYLSILFSVGICSRHFLEKRSAAFEDFAFI